MLKYKKNRACGGLTAPQAKIVAISEYYKQILHSKISVVDFFFSFKSLQKEFYLIVGAVGDFSVLERYKGDFTLQSDANTCSLGQGK